MQSRIKIICTYLGTFLIDYSIWENENIKIYYISATCCFLQFCGFLLCLEKAKEIILKNVDENAHLPFYWSGPQSHCSRNFPLVTPLQNPSASLFSWLNCSLSENGKCTAKIKGKIQKLNYLIGGGRWDADWIRFNLEKNRSGIQITYLCTILNSVQKMVFNFHFKFEDF